jgi:protein-L-isoaspartate(D-aspartate) O-methyltransferase
MTEQNYQDMRRAMVASQLRTTGVNDARVLQAMGEVPREQFVPDEQRAIAYADAVLPLPGGGALNPPMALGLLLTEARLDGSERALVIGAATGYSEAVLARLVASVDAIDVASALSGQPDGAPYDFILIDGAVPEVPAAITARLADGGRIATGLIEQGVTRLAVGRAVGGAIGFTTVADAALAPLPGFARPTGFSF